MDEVSDPTELRQWLNMAETSGWSQMWDQVFDQFHKEYSRILDVLQASERSAGRKLPLNSDTVLQILAMMHGHHGPRWCSIGAIMSAWRRVGVTHNGLDPEQIPKKVFVGDAVKPSDKEKQRRQDLYKTFTKEDLKPKATGQHRVGSLMHYKELAEDAARIIEVIKETPVMAGEQQVYDLVGKYEQQQPNKGRKRITQVWGSMSLANLRGVRRKKAVEALVKRAAKSWLKQTRDNKKARAAKAKADLVLAAIEEEKPVARVLVSLDYMPASDSARVTGKIMGNFLRINRAKLQSTPEDAGLYKNRGKSNPELLAYLRATFERTPGGWAPSPRVASPARVPVQARLAMAASSAPAHAAAVTGPPSAAPAPLAP